MIPIWKPSSIIHDPLWYHKELFIRLFIKCFVFIFDDLKLNQFMLVTETFVNEFIVLA